MNKSIDSLSDSAIAEAKTVTLIDSNAPDYHQQLYGQDLVPPGRVPDKPARRVAVLEVEIDSTDESQIQYMIDRVESVKGRLPQEVLRLRKPK